MAKLLIQEEPRRSGRPTYQQFKGLQADDEANSSIREVPGCVCSFPDPCALNPPAQRSTINQPCLVTTRLDLPRTPSILCHPYAVQSNHGTALRTPRPQRDNEGGGWKLPCGSRRRRGGATAPGMRMDWPGNFFKWGGKKIPRMSNLSCTLQDVTGQTVAFLQPSHREAGGVG